MPTPTRIVGLIGSMVPYHHARWQAFASQEAYNCRLLELTDHDEFKVLEFTPLDQTAYRREALFPGRAAKGLRAVDIVTRVMHRLDDLQPDCVCLNGYASPMALGALLWSMRNHVPRVMMSESTEWDEPRRGWKEAIKSRLVCQCGSALVGGKASSDYLTRLGIPPESIFQGYDAVDNDFFSAGAAEARLHEPERRQQLTLPQNYWVACARFTPKKNLSLLVQAYARHREGFPGKPWDLVILGDGPGRAELTEAVSRLGLTDSVHLPGARAYGDLPACYGLARAFVHASTTEQWGLVVNEAMACGLPVLVSRRCGCAEDLVHDGVNGFAFNPDDSQALADQMVQLSSGVTNLEAMGSASRAIIAAWSPARFAEQLARAIHRGQRQYRSSTWADRTLTNMIALR
jgi:glycosyltransferase involved in cell wall biosynthesis